MGAYIYRRRQLFDRDPQIAEDEGGLGPRHVRLELVLFFWGGVMLVLVATLYEIWRTYSPCEHCALRDKWRQEHPSGLPSSPIRCK